MSQKSQTSLKNKNEQSKSPSGFKLSGEEVILNSSPERGSKGTSDPRSRKWMVTLWDWSQKSQDFIQKQKEWIWGEEICPTTGRKHWHAYFESKNQVRFSTLKSQFGKCDIQKCKGTPKQNFDYISKDGKFKTNMKYKVQKPLKIIKDLYPWQQQIVDIVKQEPDDRTVYWVWSAEGCKGKTSLIKYLVVNHDALVVGGKVSDISNSLHNYREEKEYYPELICINLARDARNLSYKGIEAVKDGLVTNTKYECRQHVFNSPHVIVFANNLPNFEMLSKDRWKIINLDS